MADKFIVIDKNTSFKGTITADEVVVGGTVKGDINATDRILIKDGAVVKGTIQTQKLLLEEGGQHDGLIRLSNKPKVSRSVTYGLLEQPKKAKYENKPEEEKTAVEQKSEDQKPGKTVKQKPEQREPAERLW